MKSKYEKDKYSCPHCDESGPAGGNKSCDGVAGSSPIPYQGYWKKEGASDKNPE